MLLKFETRKMLVDGICSFVICCTVSVLVVVRPLAGGQQKTKDDGMLSVWADEPTARMSCPPSSYPLDNTDAHHAQVVATARRHGWPNVWLPLTRDPSDGTWSWWDGQRLSVGKNYWAAGQPSGGVRCAIIDVLSLEGRWRSVTCDETHYAFCSRKGAFPYQAARGMSPAVRTTIIVIAFLVAILLIAAIGYYVYRRYTSVKRASASSGIYGETSEPISHTTSSRSYKLLSKSSDRELISNEEI